MKMPHIERLKGMHGERGKGIGIGALAGGIAGWLLGLTHPFNRRGKPGRTTMVSATGAVIGGAVGALIWKVPNQSFIGQATMRPMSMASDPGAWEAFSDQVIEIPETTEVLDIGKRVRQVEEVIVHPVVEAHIETIRDSVRQTEIDIQKDSDLFDKSGSRLNASTGQG